LTACLAAVIVHREHAAIPSSFQIDQLYSSGRIRSVRRHPRQGHFTATRGRACLTEAISSGPGPDKTYVFPNDLPTCKTTESACSSRRELLRSAWSRPIALIPILRQIRTGRSTSGRVRPDKGCSDGVAAMGGAGN
jgi:hypothetical protein